MLAICQVINFFAPQYFLMQLIKNSELPARLFNPARLLDSREYVQWGQSFFKVAFSIPENPRCFQSSGENIF
jgi:hypothetical protein